MKKFLSTLCFTLSLSSQAFAFAPNEHQFEVNAEIFPVQITESYFTQQDNKLEGTMFGLNGSFLMGLGRNFLKLNGRYAASKLTHKGFSAGNTDKGSAFLTEARATAGRDLELLDLMSLSPYVGIGYSYFKNHAGHDLVTNMTGWHFEKATQLYLPVGADFKMPLNDTYNFISNLEVNLLLRGSTRTHLLNCKAESTSSSGYGIRFSAGVSLDFVSMTGEIKPFIHYTKVDGMKHDCMNCSFAADPKYTSRMIGVSFGVKL